MANIKNVKVNRFEEMIKAWKDHDSPWTPKGKELEIYREFLTKALSKIKKIPKILILGATPSLRDLAHEFQAEVTVCDISLEMVISLTELMRFKKRAKEEIWVRGNWLSVPLEESYWNVVMGDWVAANIPFELHRSFFARINNWLKNEGVFITRRAYISLKRDPPKEVIENYLKKKSLSIKDYHRYFDELLQSFVNLENFLCSSRDAYNFLKAYSLNFKKKALRERIKKDIKMWEYLIGKRNFEWLYLPEEIGEKILKKVFKIVDKKFVGNYSYYPIYFLKKR